MIATDKVWKALDAAYRRVVVTSGDENAYWRGYVEALRLCLELPPGDARSQKND